MGTCVRGELGEHWTSFRPPHEDLEVIGMTFLFHNKMNAIITTCDVQLVNLRKSRPADQHYAYLPRILYHVSKTLSFLILGHAGLRIVTEQPAI
jgi:hypothetical protein